MTEMQRFTLLVFVVAFVFFSVVLSAFGQSGHRHPDEHLAQHGSFYWWLTRPDVPNAQPGSCCGDGDCYPTRARMGPLGQWQALRREDNAWIDIPEERVVTRPDELARRPDYQAHLCAMTHMTFCFVAPEGGV